MKKIFSMSVFTLGLLATSAFGQGLQISEAADCTKNPDMFFTINAAIGDDVTITEYEGYAGVNNLVPQAFDEKVNVSGNGQLLQVQANSKCVKKKGVFSMQFKLTKISTNKESKKTVNNCLANMPVKAQNFRFVLAKDSNSQVYTCH